jgi:hypothetical protein
MDANSLRRRHLVDIDGGDAMPALAVALAVDTALKLPGPPKRKAAASQALTLGPGIVSGGGARGADIDSGSPSEMRTRIFKRRQWIGQNLQARD